MFNETNSEVICGQNHLSTSDIDSIASLKKKLIVNRNAGFVKRFEDGHNFLKKSLEEQVDVYGITTGYGDSCLKTVSKDLSSKLPLNLTNFHGCGLGSFFTPEITRAILATRLVSLSTGFSGIRFSLLEEIEFFLDNDILPLIPEEGSVGASGDLTPLSYLARAIAGREKVSFQNQVREASDVLNDLKHPSFQLEAREALAIMNGTSVMTAIACLAFERATYLAKLVSRITAMVSIGLKGNPLHFEDELFAVKPHPGQREVASWIYKDLLPLMSSKLSCSKSISRLQDRYSIRCAPHIIGVLVDVLGLFRNMIEIELNSANDNPIISVEAQRIMHGGHFYGGHIAFAMDSIKTAVANLADMLDRQMALLVDEKFNNGLPPNLSAAAYGDSADEKNIHHGLKALQIAVSAWTAEALKLTMPASVFSRSTECHNQDKVSMGTIAARDCLRILQLTEQVTAGVLVASVQALELRIKQNELRAEDLSLSVQTLMDNLRSCSGFIIEDRCLDSDLRSIIQNIQNKNWNI